MFGETSEPCSEGLLLSSVETWEYETVGWLSETLKDRCLDLPLLKGGNVELLLLTRSQLDLSWPHSPTPIPRPLPSVVLLLPASAKSPKKQIPVRLHCNLQVRLCSVSNAAKPTCDMHARPLRWQHALQLSSKYVSTAARQPLCFTGIFQLVWCIDRILLKNAPEKK